MQKDVFSTEYFSFNDHGLDILRNGIIQKHFDLREIKVVEIKKGSPFKNWIFTTILGLIVAALGLLLTISNVPTLNFSDTRANSPGLITFVSFIFLFVSGLLLIAYSIKRTYIIKVSVYGKQIHIYPINKIKKDGNLDSFISFLNKRTNLKNTLN